MKILNLAIIALFCFAAGNTSFAQEPINVQEIATLMKKGNQPGFQVMIHQANLKDVEKEWNKFIKDGTKSKVEKERDEWYINGAVIESVSADPINIYSRLVESTHGVKLMAFFEIYGQFIERKSDQEKTETLVDILHDFAVDRYREAVQEELKQEEKELKDLENEHDRLVKQNESLHKDIKNYERDIEKNKDEIAINETDQERQRELIIKQNEIVGRLIDAIGDERKEAEKTLKTLEKDLKRLENKNDSYHKKIENLEGDIRQAERDIDKNVTDQAAKRAEIANQKDKVREVSKKLRGIR